MSGPKRALLLNGYMGHAAFHVGVIEELGAASQLYYDVVRGVSMGGFVGALLAQHDPAIQWTAVEPMKRLWMEKMASSESLYRQRVATTLGAVFGISQGVFDVDPFQRIVHETWIGADANVDFAVGLVDMITGKYAEVGSNDPAVTACLVHSIRSHLLFDPGMEVERSETGLRLRERWLVDGSTRCMIPGLDLLQNEQITSIDVVLSYPAEGGVLPWNPGKHYSIIDCALRHDEMKRDEVLRANLAILRAWGSVPGRQLRLFAPRAPLTTDALSFRATDTAVLIAYGRSCARDVLRR